MEHTSGKAPRTSRPVDVACFGCFHPAQASTSARSGHEAALGTPLRHRSPDTCAGPSRSFGAFGRARHTRQAAETLWALSGAAQRAPLRTGQALPGRQEGRLSPHEDSGRGSFARSFISIAKLLCLKRNLRSSSRTLAGEASPTATVGYIHPGITRLRGFEKLATTCSTWERWLLKDEP